MGYPNDFRQASNYTGGAVNVNEYDFLPGVCVLPLAEDEPTSPNELLDYSPVVVLRLHAQYRVRRFNQITGKERNPAPIASPQDTGAFVFLGGSVTVKPELNTTYNDYNWLVACEYTFVENCASVDGLGQPLGLVLGVLPVQTTIDQANIRTFGFVPPQAAGAVSLAGAAATSGYIMGQGIVTDPIDGNLRDTWSYNSQALYPAQLFYSDLPNGGPTIGPG